MGIDDFAEKSISDDIDSLSDAFGEPKINTNGNKRKPRSVELMAAAALTDAGYLVSFPSKDTSFDLIVSSKSDIFRVEVKYTSNKRNSLFIGKKRSEESATSEHFDYIMALTNAGWFIIPVDIVSGKSYITLGNSVSCKYYNYRVDISQHFQIINSGSK